MHVNTIRRWEQEKQVPDIKKLARLAEVLNTSIAYLSCETDASDINSDKKTEDRLIIDNNDLHVNLPDRPESFEILKRFFDMQIAKNAGAVPAV